MLRMIRMEIRCVDLNSLSQVRLASDQYGEPVVPQSLDASSPKLMRRKMDRSMVSNSGMASDYSNNNNLNNNNNNNNVKNERLSPGTPDTSSRSPTVTPSSASHPGTPPSNEQLAFAGCRNYSDFMRTLAAKYQANDYFSAARNGLPPPPHPRLKPPPFPMMPNLPQLPPSKENDLNRPKPDYVTLLNPLMNNTLYPPIMDMTATQALVTLLKNAADDENQNLLKHVRANQGTKRPEAVSPLDLSAGAPVVKRMRQKQSSTSSSSGGLVLPKRAQSESPMLAEDFKNWSVDEVASFVASIDICAEYASLFKEQCIDGAALPHLTEDHLITKMKMKIGPALKLRSIVAQKAGSCHSCLHCVQCHKSSSSPEPATIKGNFSDSGGSTS
ncbi:uncharacterized protein LOC123316592 isoform X2 [Coccinella septempunctata]|uniref:uncharacterized protein LOC123316592 isoform X2 n=1 Tax=Coccinella septempunctata TaxID=41139 RepID=UPI001D08A84B|nr:uncharacterized protein LOC123316592 isoform X2 [Coccinella septempunctata]